MPRRPSLLIVPALFTVMLVAAPASAEIVKFEVALSGANQVPPANTPGTGILVAEFDTDTNLLSWTVAYEAMTGPPTAAHFHGPAELGENAPVVIPLQPPLTSPIVGQAVLTDEEASDLLAGHFYLNIHSAAFPGGEIRGQLVPPAE